MIARSRSAMLCGFEPVKYWRAAPRLSRGTRRRSAWNPPQSSTLDLVSPCASDALDELVAGERVHQRLRGAGGEDVEIAAGLAAAPEAADRRDVGVGRVLAERVEEGGGRLVRFGHQPAARRARAFLERLEDEGFLLRAHALEVAQASLARRALEVVERADAELVVEHRDGLRPDALKAEQVEDGRRELLQQALMVGDGAGLDELGNLGVEVLADALDREPVAAERSAIRSAVCAMVSEALR